LVQVPQESETGYVELPASSTAFPTGTARSAEFDIPIVPRPFATVVVTEVLDGGETCVTPRDGFRMILLHLEFTSHQGASELALNGYALSVVAGGARYQPAYCGVEDPCDSRIGVPIDGSASCTVSFEVPDTMLAATLDFRDARYPASVDFQLP
jgi:hypothetical protein